MAANLKTKLTLLVFIVCYSVSLAQGSNRFKVVLDAGHGGDDAGATYYNYKEKDVALSVALKVGALLDRQSGIDVIYTRKTDVFIELKDRPAIANKAHADIFVSIHCNGDAKRTAYGAETWIMGRAKDAANFAVAKKENSVIYLEENYKTKYKGFDPNSPETFIGLMVQQEAYVQQSIELAGMIQSNIIKELHRRDRGVKQGPFWVLHQTAMPSVLIELGFMSYKDEVEYLVSEKGQNELAATIANAILNYKNTYHSPTDFGDIAATVNKVSATQPEREVKPVTPVVSNNEKANPEKGPVYKVQIATGSKSLELVPSNFKGLKNISKEKTSVGIKYYYGATNDQAEAKKLLEEAKAKGYKSAFIVTTDN
ncbi:N-acetylmuramoyl-L-alanine amidase [Flavobacterium sp. J372]|uniref:N-acetylmuramoyl-L-alanine amidase family protein n=1 Tax=Flavobacterium sp. J372 TaxID=2898436 RepID=UPI0021510D77|nr:N-acetylmuramoyl-L-alanine amidase [Flavobacterium sp. J372]MCR5862667.1 N-acetylmuramoyl-L-alanine amidase [Flavobacterium sp. J372]